MVLVLVCSYEIGPFFGLTIQLLFTIQTFILVLGSLLQVQYQSSSPFETHNTIMFFSLELYVLLLSIDGVISIPFKCYLPLCYRYTYLLHLRCYCMYLSNINPLSYFWVSSFIFIFHKDITLPISMYW